MAQEYEDISERVRGIVNQLREKLIARLPELLRKPIDDRIKELEEVFMKARPPRFAIVGRRGSGKSSLINAFFTQQVAEVGHVKAKTKLGKWYEFAGKNGKMSILDTRGLGEGSNSNKEVEKINESLSKKCPDALLFLCKAKEVDARIDEDLKNLVDIKSEAKKKHSYNAPVVGIVTQVDELDPADVSNPPFEDEEKQKNIASAKDHLFKKMSNMIPESVTIIPVCAYMRFDDGNIVHDRRWNIQELEEYLIDKLPKSAQIEWARITQLKSIQKKMAMTLVGITTGIAGAVGAEPIPFADIPILTGMQIGMIISIGYISGRELNKKSALEFLAAMGANVGVAFTLREAARGIVKFIFPGAGNVISSVVAAAGTYAIGRAAVAYFIEKKSIKEAKEIHKKERERKESEKTE